MSKIIDMMRRLTSVYDKDPNSNVTRLLSLSAEELEEVDTTLAQVLLWRDIDSAEGTTLNRIGTNVAEPRGNKTDELYRDYIKIKILSNISGGEMETFNSALSVLLGGRDFSLREGWTFDNDPLPPEPAAILITVQQGEDPDPLPFGAIDRISAAGVRATYWATVLPGSNVVVESSLEITELERTVRYCGTFAAGEEVYFY